MAGSMEETDLLMRVDEAEAGAKVAAVAPAATPRRRLRLGALAAAGAALVLLGCFGPDLRSRLQLGGIVGLSSATKEIEVCSRQMEHRCPDDFLKTGGYHCKDHKGCRKEADGPFGDCKEQCHIVRACGAKEGTGCPTSFLLTGGFHCKKHNGCRHDKQGPFPSGSCKHTEQCYIKGDHIGNCSDSVQHKCPKHWQGGFHCKDHKGCRKEEDGPFPESSCKLSDQCKIGKKAGTGSDSSATPNATSNATSNATDAATNATSNATDATSNATSNTTSNASSNATSNGS